MTNYEIVFNLGLSDDRKLAAALRHIWSQPALELKERTNPAPVVEDQQGQLLIDNPDPERTTFSGVISVAGERFSCWTSAVRGLVQRVGSDADVTMDDPFHIARIRRLIN